jgi:hypothetical protein
MSSIFHAILLFHHPPIHRPVPPSPTITPLKRWRCSIRCYFIARYFDAASCQPAPRVSLLMPAADIFRALPYYAMAAFRHYCQADDTLAITPLPTFSLSPRFSLLLRD